MPHLPPPFSVIIPAHNEAAVIARCLKAMLSNAPEGAMEVIVACNGCSDDTAALARVAAPTATVLELIHGSKPLALNSGNAVARYPIRLYVDADIVVGYPALAATAAILMQPGVMAASPTLTVDTSRCSKAVRSHYRVWMSQPYVVDNMVGSGVFGLSQDGLTQMGTFPPIIADDEFVRSRFPTGQRRRVVTDLQGNPATFTVFPPRDVISLTRIESRQRAGLADLRKNYPTQQTAPRMTSFGSLFATAGKGNSVADIVLYLALKLAGRLHFRWSRLRGREQRWLRDESSRRLPSA